MVFETVFLAEFLIILNGLLFKSLCNNRVTAFQEVFARKWERKL